MSFNEQSILSKSLWKDNDEKNQIRQHLLIWINVIPNSPFPSLIDKKYIANYFDISFSYVTNFCNNYRKRYKKINNKTISYKIFHQV